VHGSVDRPYREELLERFQLTPDRRMRTYSHGNRQKVLLVAAFATRADVLLLDEPTTGLDPLMEQVFRSCVREARDRGQTVLLSSHVLSEVEAVSDRVGMLRAGRLIDVGGLDHFRTLAATHVRVRFGHRIPELPAVSNLSAVTIHDNVLEGRIVGSIQPFITALAQCDVAELTTGPASLEELFVEHYRTGPQTPGP
jgi:ABC-2 type transport system ATP-binding protein